MTDETMTSTLRIAAPAEAVFAVLADPTKHPAIDGTGWVAHAVDPEPLTNAGQVFRMDMYHAHAGADGHYRMANRVTVFEASRAIGWLPGQEGADGELQFGGWSWRYDLVPLDAASTEVTLTYDWSQAIPAVREFIKFPAAGPQHLRNSLQHLAGLVAH